jgi:hypothetical protein
MLGAAGVRGESLAALTSLDVGVVGPTAWRWS